MTTEIILTEESANLEIEKLKVELETLYDKIAALADKFNISVEIDSKHFRSKRRSPNTDESIVETAEDYGFELNEDGHWVDDGGQVVGKNIEDLRAILNDYCDFDEQVGLWMSSSEQC